MSTMMIAPVTWQMRFGLQWDDCDARTSSKMEAAFSSSATSVDLTLNFMGRPKKGRFDIALMTWIDMPVRRCKHDECTMQFEYWDDNAWVQYDKYSNCLINDAKLNGRTITAIYIANAPYDLCIDSMLQTNRQSGRTRPLRMTGSSVVDDDTDNNPLQVLDDDSCPLEFKCPITQMPMQQPVVAADGHTYECKALQRWLLAHTTSPVTGKHLLYMQLVPNHNLRKLISDFAELQTSMAPPSWEKEDADALDSAVPGTSAADDNGSGKRMRCVGKRCRLQERCEADEDE